MALSIKTTIVPPGNADTILLDHNTIKMIVIKNDVDLVQTADDLAQRPPIADRKVIWFPTGLPEKYQVDFKIDTTTTIAFSLKLDNSVGDVIKTTDEPVDYVRMDLAYSNAGI